MYFNLIVNSTNSLVYRITIGDFYNALVENPEFLRKMGTSNLPVDHTCYTDERKNISRLFKDKTGGRTMYEFITLRAKSYAYNIEEKPISRPRVFIRGYVVKNHLTFDDHKRCLFKTDDEEKEEEVEQRR